MPEKHKEPSVWTDDLPVCKNSGIGSATNQIYREDGLRLEEHPFEDRSCHWTNGLSTDNKICFYALFDGYEGPKAADFCLQRMPAEILLGQLSGKKSDEEVKEVLKQAFVSVEKGYMDSINDMLAERAGLQYDMTDGYSEYDVFQKYPEIFNKIKAINNELRSGTSAAIALIFNNKLYVANVGNSKVLLCKTDENNVHKVQQLSTDHDLENDDELLRLSHLGICKETLRKGSYLGNQENTRCLGNYQVKGGYKEFPDLAKAPFEPVTADPEIVGGITLDESCKFLLLMSSGLYKSLEEVTKTDQVNKSVVQLVVEQFKEQSTLTGVAQAAVDKIVRIHHDWSISCSDPSTTKREDITLLVRNFNFQMPNAVKSPSSSLPSSVISTEPFNTVENSANTNETTSSSSFSSAPKVDSDLGPDQKINAYVDFSCYYRNLQTMKENGIPLPDGMNLE